MSPEQETTPATNQNGRAQQGEPLARVGSAPELETTAAQLARNLCENAVATKLFGPQFVPRLLSTLDQIRTAELLVREAQQQHPESAALLNENLVQLQWWIPEPEVFSDTLYRDHAQELLLRIIQCERLQPGTRAEVLSLLFMLAKRHSLTKQTGSLMESLSVEVFKLRPSEPNWMIELQTDAERTQLLAELRDMLSSDWRELRPATP